MNIGLALGSGSARGWSHIGIIRALSDIGIEPTIICGTSIGALVGASYVSSKLERLEEWVCSLTKFETARFFEINTRLNGFVNKERLHQFLKEYVVNDDAIIEKHAKQYASVATELDRGREVWLTKGPMIEAVWASISLPGLFPPIRTNDKWLVDGGLVNPVPVSVCRALGADIVIAVNLNGDIVGKHFKNHEDTIRKETVISRMPDWVMDYTNSVFSNNKIKDQPPGLFEAIAGSVNIIQDRITRSRMAGDPPDILLSPKLSHVGLLEFYRGSEAISEGKDCVRRMLPEIKHVLEMV
ncbi:MAG: patatin-like phospholipase family protein [Proteobacteria bacterium]|nr:patatin-like phospholipase family protein [Pseudomonadota bacterium]MBU1649970.1 patatin-like phospholipase family protein [Pseudomonadota bacterium]